MTNERAYIVTVRLLVAAPHPFSAEEAVGESLRELCEDFSPESAIVTWQYHDAPIQVAIDRDAYPVGASYDAPIKEGTP